MEKRIIKSEEDGSELVATEKLYQICVESDFRCAVSGHLIHFKPTNWTSNPYWPLTLDHIDPLKYSQKNPASWSKSNLQLLSAVLNHVKGHVSNKELIRWYTELLRSNNNQL